MQCFLTASVVYIVTLTAEKFFDFLTGNIPFCNNSDNSGNWNIKYYRFQRKFAFPWPDKKTLVQKFRMWSKHINDVIPLFQTCRQPTEKVRSNIYATMWNTTRTGSITESYQGQFDQKWRVGMGKAAHHSQSGEWRRLRGIHRASSLEPRNIYHKSQ